MSILTKQERIQNAQKLGAERVLIRDALYTGDGLVVRNCANESILIPAQSFGLFSSTPVRDWGPFDIADDGSYIYWPAMDLHLDWEGLNRLRSIEGGEQ